MDGYVVFFGCTRQREGMVLPDGVLGTAEEDVLPSLCNGSILLDLDFAHSARMLDDFRDIRLVSATHFTRDTFSEVGEAADEPVLIEYTDAVAVWFPIILDHAELPMDGPENEEHDEHVMRVPEALVVGTTRLLSRCEDHGHECGQHDIA